MFGAVEPRRQVGLRDRHPHRRGESLAERSRGHLRPRGMAKLRMAGGLAFPLAEGADIVEGEVIAGQVEERVEEHRSVPGGQDEAVAVDPPGIGRVVLQVPRPEGIGRGRRPHRQAGMARLCLLDGVRRQKPDRVDAHLLHGALSAHDEISSQISHWNRSVVARRRGRRGAPQRRLTLQ